MKIGINEKYEIKQVDNITDPTLTVIDFSLTDEEGNPLRENPFENLTEEVILKYRYKEIGNTLKVYPYQKL
jgi:hypothetical protein